MVPDRKHVSRREWMLQVLQVTGAAALAGSSVTDAQPTVAGWHTVFLSDSQVRALIVLGEGIIPGSSAARCHQVIDLILSIEAPEAQKNFTQALKALNTDAQHRFGNNLSAAAPEQINQLLISASEKDSPRAADFGLLKEWVADAYWSSQQGMRELGWKGRVAWGSFDGCQHAGSHSST